MTLQRLDRSIKYPYKVIKDVRVKMDKFTFPMDFVILDIEEDVEISLTLVQPFIIKQLKSSLMLMVES